MQVRPSPPGNPFARRVEGIARLSVPVAEVEPVAPILGQQVDALGQPRSGVLEAVSRHPERDVVGAFAGMEPEHRSPAPQHQCVVAGGLHRQLEDTRVERPLILERGSQQ
jgi:hypothetical protein